MLNSRLSTGMFTLRAHFWTVVRKGETFQEPAQTGKGPIMDPSREFNPQPSCCKATAVATAPVPVTFVNMHHLKFK